MKADIVKNNGIRSGVWRGKKGSTIQLTVTANRVTEFFQTIEGRPQFDEKFDVTGFADGEFIGFVVLWQGYHSITSWTGRYGRDEDGEYIYTLWHMVHKFHDKSGEAPTEEWDCFMSNLGKFYFQGPINSE